jgi:hypothetical protein
VSDGIHKEAVSGEPVVATIFMTRKTENTACPTIIIFAKHKIARRNAMQKIRESKQLDTFRRNNHGLQLIMALPSH